MPDPVMQPDFGGDSLQQALPDGSPVKHLAAT
jgi:hypothetical protein